MHHGDHARASKTQQVRSCRPEFLDSLRCFTNPDLVARTMMLVTSPSLPILTFYSSCHSFDEVLMAAACSSHPPGLLDPEFSPREVLVQSTYFVVCCDRPSLQKQQRWQIPGRGSLGRQGFPGLTKLWSRPSLVCLLGGWHSQECSACPLAHGAFAMLAGDAAIALMRYLVRSLGPEQTLKWSDRKCPTVQISREIEYLVVSERCVTSKRI